MDKCITCDTKIPTPQFIYGGRGCGKSFMLLNYNIRQMCCSDKCYEQFWATYWKIVNKM